MYQVNWTWNKMQNVPVSKYQFKENLLFHPEGKVAIFTQFTSKKANNLQFSFFAWALVEHKLTSISSCSRLCWHRQCKPESKRDLTALLAPSGWGHGGRLSCSTLAVPHRRQQCYLYPTLWARQRSDSIPPLQSCCTKALARSQAAPHG